ncbi:hypothetical protein MPER_00952 [Moniliophthora perniciosa FA553]|nr:hypothetical protein MPER_00952 [Moniliophthora perniciosa FA553]
MNRTRSNRTKKESENEGGTHVHEDEGEQDVLWAVGDAESEGEGEDEDIDHHQHPLGMSTDPVRRGSNTRVVTHGEEGRGLMSDDEDGNVEEGRGYRTRRSRDSDEEFGSWTDAGRST